MITEQIIGGPFGCKQTNNCEDDLKSLGKCKYKILSLAGADDRTTQQWRIYYLTLYQDTYR